MHQLQNRRSINVIENLYLIKLRCKIHCLFQIQIELVLYALFSFLFDLIFDVHIGLKNAVWFGSVSNKSIVPDSN